MKRLSTYLAIISTVVTISVGANAAQSKVEAPNAPQQKSSSETSDTSKKDTNFSDASVKCNEEADKIGSEDKWDEAFQACMKAKGFDTSSPETATTPAIPDSEGNEGDDL